MGQSVHTSLSDVAPGPNLVTIGTFDGVHRGHQYLLRCARDRAAQLGIPLLVVTFEPIPSQVVRPEAFRGRLQTPEDKILHVRRAGAESILVLPFTDDLMRQTPEQFMNALMAASHPTEVWVGEGFALGHRRAGDTNRLTEIGHELGYRLVALSRRELDGEVVSSSRIRALVIEGAADVAHRLLGYPYRVAGPIVQGAQIGRTIGFPTANVQPPDLLVPLNDGIYATLATIEGVGTRLPAMTYIGTRPALNTGARQIETNILDYSGDLYGKVLHTEFIQRLRPDADFPSVDALITQLGRDEGYARQVLSSVDPSTLAPAEFATGD
ncbi:MAG TPA: riboflavin biosynthesis protein RibF [Thermomicrobiales bacterium]|nr:riboflavin biosynthesis protein RibF [Thermomicrobiales bacterium]